MSNIAANYSIAFTHGGQLERDGRRWSFTVALAGEVSLPSGQIVAMDPLVHSPADPFVQTVLPGRYPVDLALIHAEDSGDELVAMARIRFTGRRPTVWVKAIFSDGALGNGNYQSESGTGSFMDASAADMIDLSETGDIDSLLMDLTANYRPRRYWMMLPIDRRHNAVLFSSGAGQGSYGSHFGIDEEGDTCVLVTDFGLVP